MKVVVDVENPDHTGVLESAEGVCKVEASRTRSCIDALRAGVGTEGEGHSKSASDKDGSLETHTILRTVVVIVE